MTKIAQKLMDLKKNYFYLTPDKYLDSSIENFFAITKAGADKTMPYKEALEWKVLCADETESIAFALNIIKKGTYINKNNEVETHAYDRELKKFYDNFPKPEGNETQILYWRVRLANAKIQLIINAVHKNNASTIVFSF
jgi:hypothetical protein